MDLNGEGQRILTDLAQCMGRVEGTVNGIKEDVSELRKYTQKTSERVGVIEKARSASRGWIAGAVAVAGVLGMIAGIIAKVAF